MIRFLYGKKEPYNRCPIQKWLVTQLVVAPNYSVVSEFFLGNYSAIA